MKKAVLREYLKNRGKVLDAKFEEVAPKTKTTRKNASKKGDK